MKADKKNARLPCRLYFKRPRQLSDYETSREENVVSIFGVMFIQIALMKNHLHTAIGNNGVSFRCFFFRAFQCPVTSDNRCQIIARFKYLVIHCPCFSFSLCLPFLRLCP